jgi:aspartate oxidase
LEVLSQGISSQISGFGGTSRKRMHYARDYSGAEIMRTLRDEARNRPGINVIEFAPIVELVMDAGVAARARFDEP